MNCFQEPNVASEALQTALFEAVIAAEAMHLPEPMEVDEWIEETTNVEKSDAIPMEVDTAIFLLNDEAEEAVIQLTTNFDQID